MENMYIETRTTADDVKDSIVEELRCMAFGVINDSRNRVDHPSFISAKMLKDSVLRLEGAEKLARMVFKGENLSKEINDLVSEAFMAAKKVVKPV
jgi:hypothetical protein